jgi:hypothetical protein
MDQIATASLPHIQAALNYLAATREKPVTYAYQFRPEFHGRPQRLTSTQRSSTTFVPRRRSSCWTTSGFNS